MACVTLHGLGQGPDSWRAAAAAAEGIGPFYSPSLPRLPEGKAADYGSLFREVERYCGEIPGRFHLWGLSLGAVLALHYAAAHPDRVESLVLAAPQVRMPGKLLMVQNLLFRLMPQRAFAETGFSREGMMALTRSMMELDLSREAESLACPALILWGERDRANGRGARELARRIPGAVLRVIPRGGHELNREASPPFLEALGEFYARL